MGFTANTSGVRKVLLVLVILFLVGALGYCAKSEAGTDTGLTVGFGQAAVGGEWCFDSLLITQEIANRRWLAALGTHGEGHCRNQTVRANVGAAFLRTTHIHHWAFGVGAGVWEHGDRAVGPRAGFNRPQFCAQLLVRRYLFHDRAVIDLLHCSTGGSTYYNPGLNFITFGIRVP